MLKLTGLNALLSLLAWCAADYALVRSPRYPSNFRDHDWMMWAILPLLFVMDLVVARRLSARSTVLSAILAMILAIPVGVGLILVFGVWFHLSIGGEL